MDSSVITVVMTTYFPQTEVGKERLYYARQCIQALKQINTNEPLRLHIADDGSDYELVSTLPKLSEYWETHSTYSNSGHNGIGASLNCALSNIDDLWLYVTDDWMLTRPLNIDGPIRLLRDRNYDLVRLGPIHPGLHCIVKFEETIGWWLDLQPHYGGFAFGTRPFIATKDFYNKVGPFDEQLNSYETERLYSERVSKEPVKLAYWGGIDLAGPWKHLGTTSVGSIDI